MKSVCIESAGELHPSELCGSSILQLRQMCLSLCKTVLSSKKKPHRHILPHPSIHPSLPIPDRGCTLGLFAEKAEEWRVEADSHLAGLSLPHVSGFNKKKSVGCCEEMERKRRRRESFGDETQRKNKQMMRKTTRKQSSDMSGKRREVFGGGDRNNGGNSKQDQ